jgi:hypothetical protein
VIARRLLPGVALLALLAAPARAETLVMVSPPPELDAAVRASLAPWRVKIIVVELASGTPAELALSQGAGFVVWRDQDQLVLWDARASSGERRGIPPALDDAGAAALALSIKTWMHLGAPPPPDDVVAPPIDEVPPTDGGAIRVTLPAPARPRPRLRLEAATGARANAGARGRTALRVAIGAAARTGPLELAGTVELGPTVPAGDATVDGTLGTTTVTAHARWILPVWEALTLAPCAGLVVVHNSFSGTDSMDRAFTATGLRPGVDVGAILDWRWRRLLVSAEVGVSAVPSQGLQDRNIRLDTSTHIEPRGLIRLGIVLW